MFLLTSGAFVALVISNVEPDALPSFAAIFPSDAILLILIPPIILHGGYGLDKGMFFRNIGTILFLAFAGTLVAFTITGLGLYLVCLIPWFDTDLPMRDALAFGALISAVDPVATLALFGNIRVDRTLYMLVFGESTLNDAVAVVLYRTFSEFDETHFSIWTAVWLVFNFAFIAVMSATVGVVIGLIAARLFVILPLHRQPNLEVVMSMLCAYLAYVVAEGLSCSGVMAILAVSIVLSHYISHSLTKRSRDTLGDLVHALSFLSETVVFLFLGLAPFGWDMQFKPTFIIATLMLIVLSRLIVVYGLSNVANKWRKQKIPTDHMFVMFWGGLRGAVSFGLALGFELEYRGLILGCTVFVVLFTVVAFGGTTYPIVNALASGNKNPAETAPHPQEHTSNQSREQSMDDAFANATVSMVDGIPVADVQLNKFGVFDERYLMPLFRRNSVIPEYTSNREGTLRTGIARSVRQWVSRGVERTRSERDLTQRHTLQELPTTGYIRSAANSEDIDDGGVLLGDDSELDAPTFFRGSIEMDRLKMQHGLVDTTYPPDTHTLSLSAAIEQGVEATSHMHTLASGGGMGVEGEGEREEGKRRFRMTKVNVPLLPDHGLPFE
ncbi:Na+/H+ exchanger [Kipferlia bialata]|uniref:Sodium/hydrogen exchanger n=1 Tax=Kipferlia bialata TaxID=797122 RepID=A0A9K3GG63_9EUKA|nr:Na+/H+ exchanger [Kipferlia bialata]|eukprot:g2492.t1